MLGLTFKENCPDLRNTRVIDVVENLADYGLTVDVHDPHADPLEARTEYGLSLVSAPDKGVYEAIVLAVAHNEFRSLGSVLKSVPTDEKGC